jgi:hypothetical protein
MVDDERWKARFRAAGMSLPRWARDAPSHSIYRSNVTGTWEIYTWDRDTGERRQVTDRPNGTWIGTIDPSGEWVWWFADTDGDEFGVWMRQPFKGGADEPVVPGLAPSFPAGLAVGRFSLAAVTAPLAPAIRCAAVRPVALTCERLPYDSTAPPGHAA